LNEAIQKVSDTVTDTEPSTKSDRELETEPIISDTLVDAEPTTEDTKSENPEELNDSATATEKPKDKKQKTKKTISGTLKSAVKVVSEKKIDADVLDDALWELELVLLENNVASEMSEAICAEIKERLAGKSVSRFEVKNIIEETFKKNVRESLECEPLDIYNIIEKNKAGKKPTLIMFLGFNGAGKTTNLAKLGHHLKSKGYSCVFAAGDTFRAAAIHQLEVHSETLKIPMIKHDYGSDAAAVIFDATKHAKAKDIDVVLADTAGRTHMNKNLLEELKKIVKVNRPDINILVVESIAGNDIVEQGRVFSEAGVDGIILSKWDVDQKGGAALSLTKAIGKPIVFLGTGQGYKDLKEFNIEDVMENII
ncbi:MAG: signal recognition particle-docking protein FtsY, partial [Candidatus Aenigmarchaeota archaeon]|nr:signal recognition particle-docking protein FtsY [Candidatus Aenigmarchaeota archaeon]